jgi:hypothetical protein
LRAKCDRVISSAALGVAELLGRELHGMFTERREVKLDDVRQRRPSRPWARQNLQRRFGGWGKRDPAISQRRRQMQL